MIRYQTIEEIEKKLQLIGDSNYPQLHLDDPYWLKYKEKLDKDLTLKDQEWLRYQKWLEDDNDPEWLNYQKWLKYQEWLNYQKWLKDQELLKILNDRYEEMQRIHLKDEIKNIK